MEISKAPSLNENVITKLLSENYGLTLLKYSLSELVSYDDRNYRFNSSGGEKFVLKLTNENDSGNEKYLEGQNELLCYLVKKGVNAPEPLPNIINGNRYFKYVSEKKTIHILRVLKYIEGVPLHSLKNYSPEILHQLGVYLGKLDNVLENFHHEFLEKRKSIWSLSSVPNLRNFLSYVSHSPDRNLTLAIIEEFERLVIPNISFLPSGIIHGDFNDQNILLKNNEIDGVIDFGDTLRDPYVFELAIAIMYGMNGVGSINPNSVGGHITAGFLTQRPLCQEEWSILKICVSGRWAQSLVMGLVTYAKNPNNDYVLSTSKNGWKILHEFWSTSTEDVLTGWRTIIESYSKDLISHIKI